MNDNVLRLPLWGTLMFLGYWMFEEIKDKIKEAASGGPFVFYKETTTPIGGGFDSSTAILPDCGFVIRACKKARLEFETTAVEFYIENGLIRAYIDDKATVDGYRVLIRNGADLKATIVDGALYVGICGNNEVFASRVRAE